MDDSDVSAVTQYGKLGDAVVAHFVQGIGDEVVFIDGFRIWGHNLLGFDMLYVGVFQQHSAQVAVGDDAYQFALFGDIDGCEFYGVVVFIADTSL